MDPSNEVIEPRPEARPLQFDELTEEQRSAGKQATSLLRGMARETWKGADRQSPVHSYLPVIYKEAHSNRVILLDGARGSGKSALLITLLDAYGKALLEQQVPPKYQAWISPTDRIIPVGLIDLQPLPASTHLLLHLVASLERVVEAMETRNESRKPGTAAWYPGGEDESRSRRTWRHFARVAASGWEDDLDARKGTLDSEAFAVEVEQGELQRLDVAQAFREFMDALAEDYQAWNHWQSGAPPLFLLAIDDADMNQELSVQLLELMRKLWHPRLAFLLTGDTELFINRLTGHSSPSAARRQGTTRVRTATNSGTTRERQLARQLGLDRYAKFIPLKHRCRLKELEPNQRLVKGPEIARILARIRVPVQKLPPGRPGGTLLDYFGKDSQVLEALPGRLRLLGELADSLRPLTSEPEGVGVPHASAEAITRIWQFASQLEQLDSGTSRMESMIQVDPTTGRLRIEDRTFITWEIETRAEAETPHAHLIFEVPIRAEATLEQVRDSDRLGAQTTAALLLATGHLADTGAGPSGTPPGLDSMGPPSLAHATLARSVTNGPYTHPWPLPDWSSFLDIELLRKEWESALASPVPPDAHAAERMAKAFLRTVLRVGLGEQVLAAKTKQEDPLAWSSLAIQLRIAADRKTEESSERRHALSQWALGRAGLLAAPESGLPFRAANALLDALRTAFQGDSWQRVRRALLVERRERIALAFEDEQDRDAKLGTVEAFIHSIDQQFPAYDFRHWVENVEGDTAEQERVFSNLQNVLQHIPLPHLENVTGERGSLATYFTQLRWDWLKKAPTPMLQNVRTALDSFTRIRDAGAHALMRFWKAAYESTAAHDVAGALVSINARLLIAEPYEKLLEQKTRQPAAEAAHLGFSPMGKLSLTVHDVNGASTPFMESKSASSAVNGVLEVVLRMAFDHEKDRSKTPSDTALPFYWRGIEVRFQEGQRFHPWPVPPWPTLFEWESLEQRWSEALQLAGEAIETNDAPPDVRIIDALAYWMLSVCQSLQTRSTSYIQLQLQTSAADWGTLLRAQSRPRDSENREIRAWLYEEWRNRLPLMAAPESGLSSTAAANILASLFSENVRVIDRIEASDRMPQLRKMRMVEAGIPADQVDSLLSSIDRANPEHPWVQRFGVWDGTGDTSPR